MEIFALETRVPERKSLLAWSSSFFPEMKCQSFIFIPVISFKVHDPQSQSYMHACIYIYIARLRREELRAPKQALCKLGRVLD